MINKKTWMVGGSALALMFAVAPQALGQDAAATTSEDIVVTGSRLGRSAFTAPTPVNVVGDERMKALAIPSVADGLNQLPSFRAITSPSSQLFRATGVIGARTLDLRGLGVTRTLVLLDGRRIVPSGDNGTVDLNAIPSSLVKRTEVVTGGASAAYGADAVAGVVNLILDNKFTGIKSDLSAGVSGHGDAVNYFGSVAGGTDFAGGRGHVVAAFEYQNEQGVGRCVNRDFCAKFTNYPANPGFRPANATTGTPAASLNGLPAFLVRDNVLFVQNRSGILLGARSGASTTLLQQSVNAGTATNNNNLAAALRGKQFSADGQSLVPFQFGDLLSGNFMVGGDPSVDEIYGYGNAPLVTPTNHASFFTHADYDLTDNINIFGEFMFNHVVGGPVKSTYPQEAATTAGGNNILFINNPYIAPAVRAQVLAADPTITALIVHASKPQAGDQSVAHSRTDTIRFSTGLEGGLGFKDWKWDASYTYGKTDALNKVNNARLAEYDGTLNNAAGTPTNNNNAINAVTPPGGYAGPIYRTPLGAPVICASSVTAPTNGCIPVNILGTNSLTPEVLNKYFKDGWQTRDITQHAAAANLNGTIWEGWAGPISGALGVEWREDIAEGNADQITLNGVNCQLCWAAANPSTLPRILRDVTEGYVETSIPLLRDLPFVKNLTIDGSKRWTHYSTSGDASAWKAGVVYEPDDQVLLRLTQSGDIRAPTASELNPNAVITLLPTPDPFIGGTAHLINTVTSGNPNLALEEAVTRTGGLVLKPKFLPGFRVSSDYYLIKVGAAIDAVSPQAILTTCFSQNLLCDLVTFSGAYRASQVNEVRSLSLNLSKLRAEGVELVAGYSFAGLGGDIDLSLNGNYIMDLRGIGATGAVTRADGITGNAGTLTSILGVPQYKLDALATYSRDNWSITAHGRYIPESWGDYTKIGPDDARYNINLPNSIDENRIDSRFYLDLSGSISPEAKMFGAKMQVYGSITNVLDTEEPDQLRLFGNPLQYDPIGRAFRVGIRSNW